MIIRIRKVASIKILAEVRVDERYDESPDKNILGLTFKKLDDEDDDFDSVIDTCFNKLKILKNAEEFSVKHSDYFSTYIEVQHLNFIIIVKKELEKIACDLFGDKFWVHRDKVDFDSKSEETAIEAKPVPVVRSPEPEISQEEQNYIAVKSVLDKIDNHKFSLELMGGVRIKKSVNHFFGGKLVSLGASATFFCLNNLKNKNPNQKISHQDFKAAQDRVRQILENKTDSIERDITTVGLYKEIFKTMGIEFKNQQSQQRLKN